MTETDDRGRVDSILYQWPVSRYADTPLDAGLYTVQVFEGEMYRSRATQRVYSVREIDRENDTVRYEYTRGAAAEPVEREDDAKALAVVDGIRGSTGGVIDFKPAWPDGGRTEDTDTDK